MQVSDPEHSASNENRSDAYGSDLAYIHDVGFGDHARFAADYFVEQLRMSGHSCGKVVDLGCGSGILAKTMSDHGYEVLGIDLSSSLLAIARERVPKAEFRLASCFDSDLPACIGVSAIGECFNYLFDDSNSPESFRAVLHRAYAALLPSGLLLFDVAEPGRNAGLANRQVHRTGADWAVLVDSVEDREQMTLTRSIHTFRQIGEHYRRGFEQHILRLMPRAEVASMLKEIGFQVKLLDRYGEQPFPVGVVGILAQKAQA